MHRHTNKCEHTQIGNTENRKRIESKETDPRAVTVLLTGGWGGRRL